MITDRVAMPSGGATLFEKCYHVPGLDFNERRQRGFASQRKVGIETVGEPFQLNGVPG
jgi:hypothetical protein